MKTKFYPLRALFFTLLLSFSFTETIRAQAILLEMRDWTNGGDGTRADVGDKLIYTITVTGPQTMVNPKVVCPIPNGTAYVPQSTKLNGVAFPDQFGTMPWATAQLIPTPLPATNNEVKITFEVIGAASSGVIKAKAELQIANISPIPSNQTETIIIAGDCSNKFYALTTMYPPGYLPPAPTLYWPYQFIRELNISTGSTSLVYDGKNGACKNAVTQADLPVGSVLTEAAAMALQSSSNRLYFVNQPVNNVPADLCYYTVGNPVAYRIVGSPLTQNTTSPITRMTMDANDQGYALTDDGQELIHFTADASSVNIISNTRLVDVNNVVLNEPGGDIVCDGSGNLILITFAGKVYRINTSTSVATYLGSIAGFPAAGCQSVAMGPDGYIYIGGRYLSYYKLTLSTLTLTTVTATSSFASSDFAGCSLPAQTARVAVNETTTPLPNEVSARVQPNPFRKELNMQVQLTNAENVKIRLVDFYGRTVYTTTKQLGAGTNSLQLPVPANLSSGIYVVDVWAGNNHLLQKKLVKQ